jgi:hypothetical protein
MIPIGIFLDVIIWRRRHLAFLIVYYEFLSLLIQSFCPYDFGNFKYIIVFLVVNLEFVLTTNDPGPSIIVWTFFVMLFEFFQSHLVFD